MKMSQIFKTSQQPRCCHNTKNGSDCKATPQTGKQYCFFHDPATREKRAEARRAGAAIRNQTTKLPPSFPIHSLQSAGAVVNLLDSIVNHVLQGEMDMRSAIGFGYISAILLSGIHKRDLEKRQAALEAAVNGLSLLKKRLSDEDSDVEPDEIEEVEQPGYVEMNGGSASQPSSTPDWQDSFHQNGVSPEFVENAKHESVASVEAGPLLENNPKADGHSELSLFRLAADPATSPPNPVPALPKQAQFVSPIPGLQLRHINGVNMIQIPAKPKRRKRRLNQVY